MINFKMSDIIGLDHCNNQGLNDINAELEGNILIEQICKSGKDPIKHVLYNDKVDKDIRDSLKQKIERVIVDTLKDLEKYRPNKRKETMQFLNTVVIPHEFEDDCCDISSSQEHDDNDEDHKTCKDFSPTPNNVKYNVFGVGNISDSHESAKHSHIYDLSIELEITYTHANFCIDHMIELDPRYSNQNNYT
jgi:hypothetical protein